MAAEVRGRVAFGAFVANLNRTHFRKRLVLPPRDSTIPSFVCLTPLALITLNSLSGHRLDIPGRVGLRRA
jgi:hypothetical protein